MSEPAGYTILLEVTPESDEEVRLLIFLSRFLPADAWAEVRTKISGHVRNLPVRVLSLSVNAGLLAEDVHAETVGQLAAVGRTGLLAQARDLHATTLDGIARRLAHFGVILEP